MVVVRGDLTLSAKLCDIERVEERSKVESAGY